MPESKFDKFAKSLHLAGAVLIGVGIVFWLIFARTTAEMPAEQIEARDPRKPIAYGIGALGSALVVISFLGSVASGMSESKKGPPKDQAGS